MNIVCIFTGHQPVKEDDDWTVCERCGRILERAWHVD